MAVSGRRKPFSLVTSSEIWWMPGRLTLHGPGRSPLTSTRCVPSFSRVIGVVVSQVNSFENVFRVAAKSWGFLSANQNDMQSECVVRGNVELGKRPPNSAPAAAPAWTAE